MKQIFKYKNRKDFANNVFKQVASIKNGWQRLNQHLTGNSTDGKRSIGGYNLSNVMVISNKLLVAADLMSGDNVRFFVEPFYSSNQLYAYLSTQWRHVGGNNLDIESLKQFVNNKYADLFKVEIENDGFALFQIPDLIEYDKPMVIDINFPLQKILYGPPGTGKSTKIKNWIGEHGFEVVRTTFHPDSDYNSFVGGYKPVVVKNEKDKEEITYRFVPQAFTKIYVQALKNPERRYLLVLEEINRGNCAQIFGDIFQCLDRNDAGQSEYNIEADADLAHYLASKELSTQIALPPNLYLYATMNTSDQSLFPMDSAFKRRWDWEYVPIDYAKAHELRIEIGEQHYNWGDFIKKVNTHILDVIQIEDKQMGNFFVKPDAPHNTISLAAFKSKVLFYLWSEIYKNYAKTGNTIFQYKDEKDTIESFTFSELFEEGQDLAILPRFMKALGVEPLEISVL